MWGWVAAATAVTSLLGANEQSNAVDNAATQQANSAAQANEQQRLATEEAKRQFDLSRGDANARYAEGRADTAPWRTLGSSAAADIGRLMGVGSVEEGYGGLLKRRFTMDDFNADPVNKASFEFGLSEGEKAVKRMFGARGMGRSGAAIKAATRYAEDYAGTKAGESRARFIQDQDTLYNRLASLSGMGQTASTGAAQLGAQNSSLLANLGQNYAGQVSQNAAITGNNIVGAGNARGAASIAQGNSVAGGLTNAANSAGNFYMMDRILNSGGGGAGPSFSSRPGYTFGVDDYNFAVG